MRKLRIALVLPIALCAAAAHAFQIPPESPLDRRVIPDPSLVTPPATLDVESLSKGHALRAGWDRFRAEKAGSWRVVLDGRSGAPLLVEGSGLRWGVRAQDATLPALEASLRGFLAENRDLLLAADDELVLNREGTGLAGPDTYQVVFDRVVRGIPVEGERYVFTLGYGNLMAFGASRWSGAGGSTVPALDAAAAVEILADYAGVPSIDAAGVLVPPTLRLVPAEGPPGEAYRTALVWKLALSFAGERGTWVGMVDAHDGRVRAFFDDDRYAQVKGGVHPVGANGVCPDGCQQPNYPMPFARVTVDGSLVTANDMGLFTCQPGGAPASIDLTSPTIRISDACGTVNEVVSCDGDIDLGTWAGSNCSVAPGASAGNTKASRTCFWIGNRLKEHARSWLPTNNWVNNVQTTINTNVANTCNAGWGGTSLSMFRAGSGCNNTCDAVGVVSHEWGHGMDQNDGGGFDNPSEAYGDISEFLMDHTSCIGSGFFVSGNCSGYGDSCLSCSGIRDMDWNARAAHTPATPASFLSPRCPSGSGPCGKEVHCEAYVAGESMWDLAVRDLPASGLDQATAWQVADRLWYQSRTGSGGNMYTCTLPNASGCAASALFSRLRVADDDDGNLANGTPHAAAIFAAFNRHGIACGAAGDSSNQSTTVCPALAAPAVNAESALNAVQLSWSEVPGATSYRVLRNDVSCSYGYTLVASVAAPATSYLDTGLANSFGEYYRVQAVGANAACEGTVSDCLPAAASITGPFALAGTHQTLGDACGTGGAGGDGTWDAGETVQVAVPISNIGAQPLTNLTATLTSSFPGIEILDGTASYPEIAPGGSAGPLAPYFTVRLPAGAACGASVSFDVAIAADGGSWSGFFSHALGEMVTAVSTPLNEGFGAGIPATWSVVNSGTGTGPAATWTAANPGGRTFTPPLSDPVAIVDSNFAGSTHSQDEQLITPAMNLSAATSVTLQFDHYFRWFSGHNNERGDVDVRSSVTGGGWVNVLRFVGASSADGEHRTLDISPQAAGGTNAQVRFRYYLGSNEWWWEVDNVRIDATGPVCTTTVCAAGPTVKPVGDGVVGFPMLASRGDAAGATIDLSWDVATCSSSDHEVLYGSLAGLPGYALDGSVCAIGDTGSSTWSGVPAGDLWFVVVGTDAAGTEGSWGSGPGGGPRNGGSASGQCGNASRDDGGSCP